MTREELIENLGTIAHSGSKAFLQQIKENAGNPSLIGQFGVGFYSAFMVGTKVTVYTRSYKPEEAGWIWTSDGVNSYEIEPGLDLARGTKIVINLKEARSRVLAGAPRGSDHQAILEFCGISDRAERQRGQHDSGDLDAEQDRAHRDGLRGVLQVHRP